MPEIANCPVCGSEECDFESTKKIFHCGECAFRCFRSDLVRISAAMELAEAKAWRQEVWEATRKPWDFVQVLRERKSIESIYDIFDKSEEDVKSAEKRVLEVFTQKQP